MNLQVLAVTMNQKDFSKFDQMNVQSDVIYANQADYTGYDMQYINGFKVEMITTQTRGVSKNRNLCLIYADADILLFSDDDVVYNSDYSDKVIEAFENLPDADAIIFNLNTKKDGMVVDAGRRNNNSIKKVNFLNCMNYGTCRLAVKRKSVEKKNISFNDCFGGGNVYSNGEDVLFICDLLKNKMKIYTYPYTIGTVTQDTSTWFSGYNKKFLYDKGVLFAAISKTFAKPLCLQLLLRHKKMYREAKLSLFKAYKIMSIGIKGYDDIISYDETVRRGMI